MRDGEILRQFENMASAVTQDNLALQNGVSLVRTRLDALEVLFLGSRFGILKLMILQMVSPRLLARMVQAKHQEQIIRLQKVRQDALKARAKIKAPQSPTIIKAI